MTMPRWIKEVEVSDGKGGKAKVKVKPGDMVDLTPVNLLPGVKEGTRAYHFAQERFSFHRNWLGEGPYAIANIGKWPCGKVMLYLKTATSSGAGVFPNGFMVASSQ